MPEGTSPVRPVRVEYVCDHCHAGTLKPTGQAYMTSPPQYPHECQNCGRTQTFRHTYPYIRYDE